MKFKSKYFLSFVAGLVLVSCSLVYQSDDTLYLGNLSEHPYAFLSDVNHQRDNNMLEYICGVKYCCNTEAVRYKWLRNPVNLKKTYTAYKTIGLEKWVSKDTYLSPLNSYYLGQDWNGESPQSIVEKLITSYDQIQEEDSSYESKFWLRRKTEGNARAVFEILRDIEAFYSDGSSPIDPTMHADTVMIELIKANYNHNEGHTIASTMHYFNVLRNLGLHYSAFNLIHHPMNSAIPYTMQDSLKLLLPHDTLDFDSYHRQVPQRSWLSTPYEYGP